MLRKYSNIVIILLFAFAIRIFILLNSGGMVHPDEIFQSIEPAHKLAYGYGIMAWEWTDGIRSWFLPAVYMVLLKTGNLFNIKDSLYLAFIIHLFNIFLSLITVYAMFIIGKETGRMREGVISALLGATCPLITVFAHRPLSESLSMNFIMLALALLYKNVKTIPLIALAGVSIGIAFLIRFPSGIFFIPLLIFLFVTYERYYILYFIISLCLILFAAGTLDYFTWGSFFHAPVQYFKFNILENKSAGFGTEPVFWYLKILFFRKYFLENLFLFFLTLFFIAGAFNTPFLFFLVIFYLLCFSLIPHKEFRFIIPLFPVIMVLIPAGMEKFYGLFFKSEPARKKIITFTVILIVLSFLFFTSSVIRGVSCHQDVFSAMNFAGKQSDVRGVIICGNWVDSGGYFYLHKNIPLVFRNTEDILKLIDLDEIKPDFGYMFYIRKEGFNYVIADDLREDVFFKHGFIKVAVFGKIGVYKRNY